MVAILLCGTLGCTSRPATTGGSGDAGRAGASNDPAAGGKSGASATSGGGGAGGRPQTGGAASLATGGTAGATRLVDAATDEPVDRNASAGLDGSLSDGSAVGILDGGAGALDSAGVVTPTVVETLDLLDVWSGHPVDFALLTQGDQQFAAFFDANRQMTVAQRTLGSMTWAFFRLDTMLGWDSHNYVTMAIDGGGFLHVSGNMHGVPLIYFRSTRALDASSLQRVNAMVGANEQACTYPQFFRDPAGDLVFAYRDGASGSGNYIFDVYSAGTRTWARLLNTPLVDGQGTYSAYPVGPIQGPDGWYHLVWVWRDTPDASTNHDLSYAKSQDLIHWQTAAGRALTLPITFATADIVDPVPVNGGMINNNTKIGFDGERRPVLSYHKYDAAGNTQLYNARFENNRWVPHQTSAWSYRWVFGGGGTLVFEIEVEPAMAQPNGQLTEEWYHARYGGWGAFQLDPTTLRSTATIAPPLAYPRELDQPQSPVAGMVVRWASDAGAAPDPKLKYLLRWETLESNRDLPRSPVPAPTRLRLYGVRQP
jgi:BNR repeat-containing family member